MSDLIDRFEVIAAINGTFAKSLAKDRALDAVNSVPSAQPEKRTNERTETHACDCISRQAAIDALRSAYWDKNIQSAKDDPCIVDAMTDWSIRQIKALPSAQPEIIRCKDCQYQSKGQNESETWNLCGYRPWQYTPTTDEHFCGYAERREE